MSEVPLYAREAVDATLPRCCETKCPSTKLSFSGRIQRISVQGYLTYPLSAQAFAVKFDCKRIAGQKLPVAWAYSLC